MTFEELEALEASKPDLDEADVRDLLDSPNERERLFARQAVAKTLVRRALTATAELAREEIFSVPSTLSALDALVGIADIDEPYVEVLKLRGLRAARLGEFDRALTFLQLAMNRAVFASNRSDSRSRRTMRFIHDEEIAAAVEKLSKRFQAPARRAVSEPLRLALICSSIQDEDGPSIVTYKRAIHFRETGFDVVVASTENRSSTGSRLTERLRESGLPFYQAVGETHAEKVQATISYFAEHPVDAASYSNNPHDLVGDLLSCIGIARVQAYDCLSLEPLVGKYDLICHSLTPEQEVRTRWPGRSRYFGSAIALEDEIDAATPMPRAEIGIPADAVLLATFGRMTKCDKPVYLAATAQILQREPKAWLILAGPDDFGVFPHIESYYREQGVLERVRYLGLRQEDGPRLLKTADVYCETYPWPGGQSLGDAMHAGLPIVAMRPTDDPNLDPTGCGPTTAVAEIALGGIAELAAAGDIGGYADIASAYIRDTELRKRVGALARDRALMRGGMRRLVSGYAEAIRALIAAKAS